MSVGPTTFQEWLDRQQAGFDAGSPLDLRQSLPPTQASLDADQLWTPVERDLKYRLEKGLVVPADEYVKTFPGLADQVRSLLTQTAAGASAFATIGPADAAGSSVPSSVGSSVGSVSGRSSLPGPLKQLRPGTAFGPYDLLDILGKGGMGVVYKARHRVMKRLVALKVVGAAAGKNETARARFQREAKAAARLTHPNIVAAFDAGEIDGIPFLALEYIPGDDLSTVVKKGGPLPPEKAVRYVLAAAQGLGYAHGRGVIHRDVKPSNLLLDTETEAVKVLDLGLSRVEALLDEASRPTELTSTGALFGTVDYMAPEQARDAKRADARADVYSLGCTLFYLLAGRSLYPADNVLQKLRLHREGPIPRLNEVIAGVPNRLDAVFRKMVAKQPEHRYATMNEAAADLEQALAVLAGKEPDTVALAAETTQAYSAGEQTRAFVPTERRRRGPWLTAAAVMLLVGAAAAWWALHSPETGSVATPVTKEAAAPEAEAEPVAVGYLNRAAEPLREKWDWPEGFPAPAVAPFSAEAARKHQEAWAAKVAQPVVEDGPRGMKLVLIPPGEFDMGSPGDVFGLSTAADNWAAGQIDHARPVHPEEGANTSAKARSGPEAAS